MKITLVFNYPCPHTVLSGGFSKPGEHDEMAARFVASYASFPPGIDHNTVVIANGGQPTPYMQALCASLPGLDWFVHDDSGWDIGGFIAVSRKLTCDFAVWMGGLAWVRRAGWMRRMAQAWTKRGPGCYGSLASYQIRPHLVTSGFWCSPKLVADYPVKVETHAQRGEFEHGQDSISMRAFRRGMPVMLVTWDGEWTMSEWRKPRNIFRRGDQSNCLTYYRHTDLYDEADAQSRRIVEAATDTWQAMEHPKRLAQAPVAA